MSTYTTANLGGDQLQTALLYGNDKKARPQSASMIDQRIASSLDPSRDILTRSWANATAPRETKDHPAIKLLDDLTTLSAAEIELQKKTEILNNLKVELIQLLQNQREKDLRYVEMEETLDKAELNRSLEDHLQLKVEKVSKDLKTSKKRCGELSSEVAQANMRIRGLHEELKSEKDKNKLSAEHVAMLKDSLEEKQTSIVELKRMLDAERMAVKEMRQRMSLLQKSLDKEKSSAAAAQQEKTRQRDHSVAQVERKLQGQIKELEEKVMLSKASETAVTARVRSLEKELSDLHSEAVSIAKPWMSHHPLPSRYSAVACVHELKGRCELLRRNEEKLSQQLAATESKFQQSTDSLEGVTDVLSSAAKESNSNCQDLLHTLSEVVEKLTSCQTPVPHHSSTCSSSSSSTDSSEEEGDGENQHVEPVEQDCTFVLKRCIAQLISTAKNHLQEIHAAHHQLCQVVNGNCEAVGITGTNSEQMVEAVFSELKAAQDRIKELNDKLSAAKHDHEVSWNGALTALRTDTEERTKIALETARQEERKLVKEEMSHLVEELTQQQTAQLTEKRQEIEVLNEIVDKLNKDLSSKHGEVHQLKTEKSELVQSLEEKEETLSKLKANLELSEKTSEEKLSQAEEELSAVQVVSHQHALTIVAMEKKLVAAVTKIAALETSLSELQLVNRNIEGSPVVGEVPSEVTSDVPNSNHGDQEKEQLLLSLQEEYGKEKAMLEQELSLVKEQHSLSIQKCEKLERRNTELEEEMSSAKEEYLKAREQFTVDQREKLEDLNQTLSKQEEELSIKQQEIDSLKVEVVNKTDIVEELQLALDQLKSTERALSYKSASSVTTPDPVSGNTGTLASWRPRTMMGQSTLSGGNASELGALCVSERHSQIISQQKLAIKDLRLKLKEMRETKPPTPSQLALIQKTQELSCKVNTLESEVSLHSRFQGSTLPEGLEARTRTASTPDVEVVSATEALDLQTALEASEHMLIQLLVGLCDCLSYEPTPPRTSAVHLQSNERADLIKERKKSIKIVNCEVEKVVKLLQAKESELKAATKELKELKHVHQEILQATASTTSLAEERSKQLQKLTEDLAIAQDELDEQKRLNETLIKRRRLTEDQHKRMNLHRSSHSCMTTPEEMQHRLERQKVAYGQQLQKKTLEITGLKKELKLTDHKLQTTEMRLKAVKERDGLAKLH